MFIKRHCLKYRPCNLMRMEMCGVHFYRALQYMYIHSCHVTMNGDILIINTCVHYCVFSLCSCCQETLKISLLISTTAR